MSEKEPNMLGGNVLKAEYPTLGDMGLGRGSVGEGFILTPALAEVFLGIESGDFDEDIPDTISKICIDERFEENGVRSLSPRNSGGPVGVAHAHDLAMGAINNDQNEEDIVRQDIEKLVAKEEGVCAHGDDHSACGCGFIKLVKDINIEVKNEISKLVDMANRRLGYEISDEQEEAIRSKAEFRDGQEDFYAEDRATVSSISTDAGAGYEGLVGPHDAQVIIWETEEGKSPDMVRLFEETGVKGFVIHAWAFGETAKVVNVTGYDEESDLTAKVLALNNLATLSVLCSSDMPIIVK